MSEDDKLPHPLSPQDALVMIMLAVSASDTRISTPELLTIEDLVDHLPVFGNYDADRIHRVAQTVFDLLEEEDGLDALFGLVREALPEKLYETAYALACDVAAADSRLREIELAMLAEIREQLKIDRLHAAAIEWGTRVRYMVP